MAGAMWEFIGLNCLLQLGDEAGALRALREAERLALGAPGRRGDRYWLIARLAEGQGEWEVAAEFYRKLVEKAPRNLRRDEAKERLAVLAREVPAVAGQPVKEGLPEALVEPGAVREAEFAPEELPVPEGLAVGVSVLEMERAGAAGGEEEEQGGLAGEGAEGDARGRAEAAGVNAEEQGVAGGGDEGAADGAGPGGAQEGGAR